MNIINGNIKLFLFAIMAATMLGCDDSSDKLESVMSNKTVKLDNGKDTYLVGVDANYPPLEFRGADGQLVGLEIDMFSAVAKDQGFNATFMPMRWGDIMPSLDSGERDVGMSFWYSDERAEKYDMSIPLYSTKIVMARLKKNGHQDSVEDIRNARISLQGPNTLTHKAYGKVKLGSVEKNNQLIMTTATYLAFKSLIKGDSDYVLDSEVQLRHFIKTSQFTMDDFVFINDDRFPSASWVYAVKKGNKKLLNKINTGVENLRDSGVYKEIEDKWIK